jgi:hypothetical protein
MATTTNYGWTTPDDTALVKDGASAIRSLGTSIDTTTKNLNPSTTLGDIEYRSSTSNTNTRLGIGTSGQVLTVSGGVPAWTTLASGVEPQINPQVAGNYVFSPRLQSVSSLTASEDITWFAPVYLNGITFDRISCATGGTFSGTATVRMGIYNHSATTGKPTTVYLDAGTVSCTAASTTYEITINSTPPAGLYWLAWNAQTAATTNVFSSTGTGNNALSSQSLNTITGNNKYSYWYENSITGAFATAGTLVITTSVPVVGLRMA